MHRKSYAIIFLKEQKNGGSMDKSIAIYSRKSKMTGIGESIDNQIELCRKYIADTFGDDGSKNIIVFEDEGFSGGNVKRPQFTDMMEKARRGEISAVVCYRLDRISRNTGDFARLIEEFEQMDVDFISIKERFDTSSPMGRAMMYISSVFSQLERETIAERIRDNMLELSKTGRWLGGVTPLGYRSENTENFVGGRVKRSARLVIDEDEAENVRMIYETFLFSEGLTDAVDTVNSLAIRTRKGKTFSRFSLKKILTNPIYTQADGDVYDYFKAIGAKPWNERKEFDGKSGVMIYNRTLQKKGRASKMKKAEEWIVTKGTHEAIIQSDKWLKVQMKIKRRNYLSKK